MSRLRTLMIGEDGDRRSDRLLLEQAVPLDVVAETASLDAGVSLARDHQPDVVAVHFTGNLEATLRRCESIHLSSPLAAILLVGALLDVVELGRAMQVGIREVVSDPALLGEAARRAHVFMERLHGAYGPETEPRSSTSKLVVVHSPKGGSGKSTLAANLAAILANEEPRGCVLVDLGGQFGEVDLLFNIKPQAYLSDLARLGGRIGPEALEQALVRHDSGVGILAGAPSPEESELIDRRTVETVLELLRRRGGCIVVDTPSSLSEPLVRALELADHIIVPLFPELSTLRRAQQALRLWGELGIDPLKAELVAWDQKSEIDSEAIARVLQRPLAALLPFTAEAALAAINSGTPMVVTAPKGPLAKALRTYAARFVERPVTDLVAVTGTLSSWRVWWTRLRRRNDVSAQPT